MSDSAAGPELRWSIRSSFFRYVAGLPDGRASVSGGAAMTQDDPQVVVFPADLEHTTDAVLAFQGDLRMSGHGGLLFLRLANPRIEPGERATLTVDDPATEDGSGPRLPLVTLTLSETEEGWLGSDVQLTAQGVAIFNQVYATGERFDDLTIVGAPALSDR